MKTNQLQQVLNLLVNGLVVVLSINSTPLFTPIQIKEGMIYGR
jgi:hypothetical protein